MQLADAVWRRVKPEGSVTEQVWQAGLGDARMAVADGMERLFSSLPAGQQKVLRTFASDGSIYGRAAEVLQLTPGAAQSAQRALTNLGHVRDGDGQRIVDPLLADWISHRFSLL